MKKLVLLLLISASTQMQGMEQLKKLKTAVLKKYYKVDDVWVEVFSVARRIDRCREHEKKHHDGRYDMMHKNCSYYQLGPIKKTLSRIYGVQIQFLQCNFRPPSEYKGTCSDIVNEFYEKLEGKKAVIKPLVNIIEEETDERTP